MTFELHITIPLDRGYVSSLAARRGVPPARIIAELERAFTDSICDVVRFKPGVDLTDRIRIEGARKTS